MPAESPTVQVVYALPDQQTLLSVPMQEGLTAAGAIRLSGILDTHPDIDLEQQRIGIFSQPCEADTLLRAGDRVEIYRDLIIDPMEARRLRARPD